MTAKLIYANHLLERLDYLFEDDRKVGFLDPQWIRFDVVQQVIDDMPAVCPACKMEIYDSPVCPNCGEINLSYDRSKDTIPL